MNGRIQNVNLGRYRHPRFAAIALVVLSFCFAAGNARAGSATGVVRPYFYGGYWYLDLSQTTRSGNPACVTRPTIGSIYVSVSDQHFAGILSLLIAAWYSGQSVTVGDTNNECDASGDEIFNVFEPAPAS